MKKYKVLKNIFTVLALIFSHEMCIRTAYSYASMLCGIEHKGFSAPANVVFLFAIPYVIAIIVCAVLALIFGKKAEQRKK